MNILNRLKNNGTVVAEPKGVFGVLNKLTDDYISTSEIYIRDTYVDNYDILQVHRKIIKKLESEKPTKVPKIKEEIRSLKELESFAKKPVDKFKYQDKIMKLEKQLEEIETGSKIAEYRKGTEKYLETYAKTHDSKELIGIQSRLDAIEQYLDIAKKYAKIEVTRIMPEYYLCDNCGYDLRDVDMTDEIVICPGCESMIRKYVGSKEEASNDTPASGGSGSVIGDDSRNFRDTLKRFQGKEQVNIPAELYTKLDEYFETIDKPIGEYYKDMAPLADGTKQGTSKKIMSEALKKIKCSSYYENEASICREYWGWELPDLSAYEDTIIELYFEFQACYQSVKGYERKSSLATQVILWLILHNLGIMCSRKDFRLVEIDKTVSYYRQVLEECTKKLGWKNIPL
jgi:predicted Zn-ribbon and HTH transcriptional regulator